MATARVWPALLQMASLLFSPDGMLAATQKATVTLEPPWNRIFKGDNVTLICHGKTSLEAGPFTWIHNGTISKVTTSRLDIVNANFEDSGKYKCQINGLYQSESVHLEVFSDWLLLQSSAEMVREGETFLIRCHGWRNWNVYKVIYYKDDVAFKYMYQSPNITITSASLNDSGTYHCDGRVRRLEYHSERLKITVIKAYQSRFSWLQVIIPLAVAMLFAVDTGILFSTREQFKSILKIRETRKSGQHKSTPQSS
ncbi:high affinity immunoglobulin epsilon receptor subunit alpha [Perognathus longimembris pacificus]|uniref:high affinity immunoglobulin epsilon receptor subunit alpha n=1 Tax=Perognathus longimembris pacificus TaxID=214514 RepID=UPI0020188E46|nr:high affinity immunoglobulin epsilon receptor subunit alpha [Perognathus longimembris pacificus]